MEQNLFYEAVRGMALEHRIRTGEFNMKIKHFHPEYEIFYIISGSREFFFDNRFFSAGPGDLILIDSQKIHMTRSVSRDDPGHDRIILYLTPDQVRLFDRQYPSLRLEHFLHNHSGVFHLNAQEQDWFYSMCETFEQECRHKKPGYDLTIEMAVCQFLNLLSHDIRSAIRVKPKGKQIERYQQVYAIADYLTDHCEEDSSLEELSLRFHLSGDYISRIFKSVTGYNVREFININRVKKAQELLLNTQLPVSDIAQQVGFSGSSSFEKIFRSYMSVTPLKFRKRGDVFVSIAHHTMI